MCQSCGCGERVVVEVHGSLLEENRRLARENRRRMEAMGARALNLMGSPGCGKTLLLERTVAALRDRYRLGVIEGDIETDRDARRIRAQGVPVVQLTTGGACHLNAALVQEGLERLAQEAGGPLHLIFIENVGNLVCPSDFDLGEHARVALLSVPEGSDKPAKYPALFRRSALFLITKMDLLHHFDFSVEEAQALAREINPAMESICLSARTGQGLEGWLRWLQGFLGE